MESRDILLTCPHCGRQNSVRLFGSEESESKCTSCGRLLFSYSKAGGYVYILSNPRMKGLLKIGFSTRPVSERIAELSSATGVPAPFELEAYFDSSDPESHEREIHKALAMYRVRGREFFEVDISTALEVVTSVCDVSPTFLNPRNTSYLMSMLDSRTWDVVSKKPNSEPYDSNYEYMKRVKMFRKD